MPTEIEKTIDILKGKVIEAEEFIKDWKNRLEEAETRLRERDKISVDYLTSEVIDRLLTAIQKTDLTDAGASTAHKHDHGGQDGLADDDHTIYIKADGTRAFSGEQSMGTNKMTNVVDPAANQDAATKKYVDDNNPLYTAGDTLLASADTETTTAPGTSYVKRKEIRTDRGGTLRVLFKINTQDSGETAYGRIYRNGIAVGTEQACNYFPGDPPPDVCETSEDIAGWTPGDLVQLYAKSTGAAAGVGLSIFRIHTSQIFTLEATLDT